MGRVNKKKMASEAVENEKGIGEEADSSTENAGNLSTTKENNEDRSESDVDKAKEENDSEEPENANDSDYEVLSKKASAANAAKKSKKRKSSERKRNTSEVDQDDDDEGKVEENNDEDEDQLNGSGSRSKKSRKTSQKSPKKSGKKSSPKKKKSKKNASDSEDEEFFDVDDEDHKNDDKDGEADADKNDDAEQAKDGSGSEEEEYEVADIVGKKVENGVTFYLIRWKGYTKSDDTWEPEDTLSCPEMIEKYNKKPRGKGGKGKPAVKKSRGSKKTSSDEEDGDPDAEYEVDKIIDYAEEKGERVFRIRWKGFGAKHDTWEPESNLNCKELIEKFMERMKSQENVSFKELREEPKKTKRLVNETELRTALHNPIGRKSKRNTMKKRVYYGDSDD